MNKQVIKKFQGDLALVSQPFTEAELGLLRQFKKKKVMRRFSAIVRHQQVGLKANCMIVWRIEASRVKAAGRRAAALSQVSHCYIRPSFPGFPYNLYTMVHGRNKSQLNRFARQTAELLGAKDYQLLWSVKELKKTSPVFA